VLAAHAAANLVPPHCVLAVGRMVDLLVSLPLERLMSLRFGNHSIGSEAHSLAIAQLMINNLVVRREVRVVGLIEGALQVLDAAHHFGRLAHVSSWLPLKGLQNFRVSDRQVMAKRVAVAHLVRAVSLVIHRINLVALQHDDV